ncbi:MAG: nucleotidyltransferase domain-containing protein [bacterium]|nr:nucleotidyltransferase domain-containing protein [bacterium]
MNSDIFTIKEIENSVKPIAEKYKVKEVYLFGSYARGEANEGSDLDFLVYGGENFRFTLILSFAKKLREVLKKDVDVFEIGEINRDSRLYNVIMKEKIRIA